jgi:hypothetical protein
MNGLIVPRQVMTIDNVEFSIKGVPMRRRKVFRAAPAPPSVMVPLLQETIQEPLTLQGSIDSTAAIVDTTPANVTLAPQLMPQEIPSSLAATPITDVNVVESPATPIPLLSTLPTPLSPVQPLRQSTRTRKPPSHAPEEGYAQGLSASVVSASTNIPGVRTSTHSARVFRDPINVNGVRAPALLHASKHKKPTPSAKMIDEDGFTLVMRHPNRPSLFPIQNTHMPADTKVIVPYIIQPQQVKRALPPKKKKPSATLNQHSSYIPQAHDDNLIQIAIHRSQQDKFETMVAEHTVTIPWSLREEEYLYVEDPIALVSAYDKMDSTELTPIPDNTAKQLSLSQALRVHSRAKTERTTTAEIAKLHRIGGLHEKFYPTLSD